MQVAGLDSAVDRVVEAGRRSMERSTVAEYEELDRALRDLDAHSRESFQHTNRAVFTTIAGKLERGASLTEVEKETLELLIVGEARFYTQLENNVKDWERELVRLLDEIRAMRDGGSNEAEALLRLRALCRDALHVVPDVVFYLRERDRIERFRDAMSGDITPEDGRFLAIVVRDMLDSPSR